MTNRYNVFVTIDGEEELILERYPATSKAKARIMGGIEVRMKGRTPNRVRLTEQQIEKAKIRAIPHTEDTA